MSTKQEVDWAEIYKLSTKRTVESHKKLERIINQLVKCGVLVFIHKLPKKGKYTLYELIDHATNLNPSINETDSYFKHEKDAVDYMNIMYEKFNKHAYLSPIEIENGEIVK